MKTLLIALLLSGAALAGPEPGFTSLFNGKDLTGWKRVNGLGEYKVEGDCIVGVGDEVKANTFLRTEKTYKDFDFRFEMKFDDLSGNSGMMFRGLQKPGEDGRVYGYQCEHDQTKARAWTAFLYDEARRDWLAPKKGDKDAEKAATEQGQKLMKWDDWNQIRILCEGKHLQIWLNGVQTVDYTDNASDFTPEGFFALQVHAGKSCHVRWRNLEIKEL
jgi:hypothetical protein